MLHEDRSRARSFGDDAALYDRARPSYPAALIDRILSNRPATCLDVGCGTGIAARLLTARGVQVLGVEPDQRMAAVAQQRGLAVEVASFEVWDAAGRQFDLLTCAQAWHWIEPAAGVAKAADVICPGGRIAIFWNLADPPGELRRRIDPIYEQVAPGLEAYSVLLGRGEADRPDRAAQALREHAGWADVRIDRFRHGVTYETAEWLDNLRTHSDHRGLPAQQLATLLNAVAREIDAIGGTFTLPYDVALVTATRA